jgi:hypothetical protein
MLFEDWRLAEDGAIIARLQNFEAKPSPDPDFVDLELVLGNRPSDQPQDGISIRLAVSTGTARELAARLLQAAGARPSAG